MIETHNTEVFEWENTLKELCRAKGVRRVSDHAYEAYIYSNQKKYHYLGTFASKEEAQKAVFDNKIQMFMSNIISSGDDPADIKPCVVNGYFVSRNGSIYNRHGKRLQGCVDNSGYMSCCMNGKKYSIHRLIALSFIPNPDILPCINHKDGNKSNNHVDNLEWCTHSYNVLHAYKYGLEKRVCGEEHHSHKLSAAAVRYIRKVYKKRDVQYGAVPLAVLFGVDRTTIADVIKNRTWREVI